MYLYACNICNILVIYNNCCRSGSSIDYTTYSIENVLWISHITQLICSRRQLIHYVRDRLHNQETYFCYKTSTDSDSSPWLVTLLRTRFELLNQPEIEITKLWSFTKCICMDIIFFGFVNLRKLTTFFSREGAGTRMGSSQMGTLWWISNRRWHYRTLLPITIYQYYRGF